MVRFGTPDETNYSEKFLSCRRPHSPYPREKKPAPCRFTQNLKEKAAKVKINLHLCSKHKQDAMPTLSNGKKATGFLKFPDLGPEIDGRQDSVQGRNWDGVLEWMHEEAMNILGLKMSEKERKDCVDRRAMGERCGCLGSLGR